MELARIAFYWVSLASQVQLKMLTESKGKIPHGARALDNHPLSKISAALIFCWLMD